LLEQNMSEHILEEINQALALLVLANQRRRLATYLRRVAVIDAAYAPPKLVASIAETRAKIARLKAIVRAYGGEVEDHPDDEELPT
jgi:hypothetical protein